MVYTKEDLEKLAHISDSEVLQDIKDTEAEIKERELQIEYLDKKIANIDMGSPAAKMSCFRRDTAWHGIRRRKAFIAMLNGLLEARKG